MTDGELDGYGQLLRFFVPRAVGLDARGRGTRPAYPLGAPVIRIHGGRGTGRTAVCQKLHDTYVNRLHVAKWPMTDRVPRPAAGEGLLASRPLAALAWLVHELNADVPKYGRIPFPRFTYGLLTVVALEESPPDATSAGAGHDGPSLADLANFEEKRQAVVGALTGTPNEATVRQRFRALVEAAVPLVRWIPLLTPLEDLIREVLQQVLAGGGRGRRGLDPAALRWWEEQPLGVPDIGIERLLRYAQYLSYQLPARARDDLEQRLAAAFLADIDAYHGQRHLFRRPRPLIILDDTHTADGERLFRLLLSAYAAAGGPGNARGAEVSRPVIVATRLGPAGDLGRPPADVARIDTLAWQSPRDETPDAWQVWLKAPALRREYLTAALGAGCPRGLPDVIRQLGAGRAGLAAPLVAAARKDLARSGHSVLRRCHPAELGRTLLALPPADATEGTTVADVMLRYLVPEPSLVDALLPWAVALRPDDVRHLPASGSPDDAEPDAVQDRVRAFLRDGHWDRSVWAGTEGFVPAVGDRALRELLLHHLRTAVADTRGYWSRLHSAALDHYRRPLPCGEHAALVARLHHTLALGRRERAVTGLHELFDAVDRSTWLAAVQFVCAAPHPPDGGPLPDPEPPGFCPACPGPQPDGRHRAIGRLVTLLGNQSTLSSLYTDDPDSADNRLRHLLNGFDIAYDDEDVVTAEAARRWPALLAGGRRVPQLPIPPA